MLEIKDILTQFFEQIREDIINESKAQDRYVTGKTTDSLEVRVDEKKGILLGDISAFTLETGRKPGSVPGNITDVILKWINNRSMFTQVSDSKKRSIAFLIGRKIAREGTLLHRQGGKSGVITNVITEDRIRAFSETVLQRLGREIDGEIISAFK